MFHVGDSYKTNADILITIYKLTPKCKYAFVGYFQLRDIRLRVFYDKDGHEFFGEKGLDLKFLMPGPGPYVRGSKFSEEV